MYRYLTRTFFDLTEAAGLHRRFEARTAGRGAILRLHRVRPDSGADYAPNARLEIAPSFLAALVDHLRNRSIDIVDLDEAVRRLRDPSAGRFVVLTFDDGYRDILQYAHPVLRERGCPFTVYVTSGFADRTAEVWWLTLEEIVARQAAIAVTQDGGPPDLIPARTVRQKHAAFSRLRRWLLSIAEEQRPQALRELAWRYGVDSSAIVNGETMDWADVRALAADPLATIGAHSVTHPRLARLGAQAARSEIRDSARVIEAATGIRPRHFAYPYGLSGDAGPRDFRLAAELGFATAVTGRGGVLHTGDAERPTALPRVTLDGRFQSLGYLDLMLSGFPFLLRRRLLGTGEVPEATASASTR